MGELRKDYVLDRWVIIATERGKRPHQFKGESTGGKPEVDFFAPGNEDKTPAEIFRYEDEEGNWLLRSFPNKFPAVKPEGSFEAETHNKFYTFAAAYGHHEVMVETPDDRQLWDLSNDEIKMTLQGYCDIYERLKPKEGVSYVQIFKNHGKKAGTSIVHSHSQIIAYNIVPSVVLEEVEANRRNGSCAYCEIISKEKDSDRRCFENESFVAFTPYASRFPCEIWVFPKEHKKILEECNLDDLADIMKKILVKLKELDASFNYMLHYAPDGEDLHFHIEIAPRLATWAGFEYNGTIINTMTPEGAAKFYRGEE